MKKRRASYRRCRSLIRPRLAIRIQLLSGNPNMRQRRPMTSRQQLLALTAAAGLFGLPSLVLAQGSGGSSMMPQTTQTTPQEGPLGGTPGARAGANAGQATGQTIPGNNAGSPRSGAAAGRQTPPNMQAKGMPAGPGGANASRDSTPGNPPSTTTQRR